MPAILTAYAREREAALAAGDDTAAYVYKILQNSFYGVLGASGCRYARGELAGAITSFGKHFLTTARDWFEARGHHVLYGDTDSVFVLAGIASPTRDHADADRARIGASPPMPSTQYLTAEIRASFALDSHLRIRCDKIYRRFFISRLRGDARRRARPRQGLRRAFASRPATRPSVEVRGMEAVRSDFTPLARRFQLELIGLVFADADLATLRAFCAELAGRAGARRARRRARLPQGAAPPRRRVRVSETPQVRAARLLGWHDRGGPIEYVMTPRRRRAARRAHRRAARLRVTIAIASCCRSRRPWPMSSAPRSTAGSTSPASSACSPTPGSPEMT